MSVIIWAMTSVLYKLNVYLERQVIAKWNKLINLFSIRANISDVKD